jgi:hypothetical protein
MQIGQLGYITITDAKDDPLFTYRARVVRVYRFAFVAITLDAPQNREYGFDHPEIGGRHQGLAPDTNAFFVDDASRDIASKFRGSRSL